MDALFARMPWPFRRDQSIPPVGIKAYRLSPRLLEVVAECASLPAGDVHCRVVCWLPRGERQPTRITVRLRVPSGENKAAARIKTELAESIPSSPNPLSEVAWIVFSSKNPRVVTYFGTLFGRVDVSEPAPPFLIVFGEFLRSFWASASLAVVVIWLLVQGVARIP